MALSMGRVIAGAAYILIRAKDETGKVLAEVNKKVATIGQKLQSVGSNFQQAGLQLAGASLMMGNAMYIGVREAQKFQDAMLAVQAVLNVTTEQIKPLEKKVRELGSTTSYTSEEVALAAEELARGGFSLEQVYESLDDVINLARAGQVTMAEAAMYMVRSMMAFNISAQEAARVSNALFVASSAGTTTVQELGSALSFSAGSAADLGMSLEEAVATLAIFSNNMLTGTKGGTSLNNLLIEMTKNASKVREIFGIEMFENGEARNMLVVFKELRAALGKMTAEERVPVLMNLFNIRGSRAAQALKQMDMIEAVMERLRKGEITAADAAKLMDSGIGGSIRRIIASLNNLAITFGLAFEGIFQSLEDRLIPLLNGLGVWFKKNAHLAKSLAIAFGAVVGTAGGLLALGAALKVFGLALTAISGIATVIATIASPFLTVVAAVGATIAGLRLLSKIPGDVGNAFRSLTDTMFATFGSITEIFGKAFDAIKDRIMAGDVEGAMNVLLVSLNQMFNMSILGLKTAWLEFTFYLEKLWIDITTTVEKLWFNVTTKIAQGILSLVEQFDILNSLFEMYSGVDYQAEIARAQRLGNDPNAALGTLDQQNQQRQQDLDSRQTDAQRALADEIAKMRDQYADERKALLGAVDQSINMSKLPAPNETPPGTPKPYSWEQTIGGEILRPALATAMPTGLEMGSTDAAKAAFDNRKATLDAAQKTAHATREMANDMRTMVKKGGQFVITGVESSTTTPAGG